MLSRRRVRWCLVALSPSACTGPILLALLLTGCAESQNYRQDAAYVRAPLPEVAEATVPRVELEDDGLPAQTPPLRRARPEPDDPTEPFSRNYGTVRPLRRAAAPAEAATVVPGDRLADLRPRVLASFRN